MRSGIYRLSFFVIIIAPLAKRFATIMKQTTATLLVVLISLSYSGPIQLDRVEIDRIDQVIRNNEFYPPLNATIDSSKRALVFGLIMSFGGQIDSSGTIAGVRVALDRINNKSDLLPGYSLHYALSDSQVRLQDLV